MLGGVVMDQGSKGKERFLFNVFSIQGTITTKIRYIRQGNEWLPKDVPHALIPRTCEYVTLHAHYIADVIKVAIQLTFNREVVLH